MKLKSYTLAVLVVVIIFGGILLSTAMNWWKTESTKSPQRFDSGDAAGQYDPADIRGSYTFGEISGLFDIPLDDLAASFRLPADVDAASFTVKDLEAIVTGLPVEVGTSSVRLFTAFYNGLPYDLAAEDTYLFPEAAEILTARNKMLPEQAAYLLTHIVTADTVPQPASDTAAVTTESAETEKKVSGSTTFQYLLDWGLSQEIIETVIGEPMPDTATLIKDFATQNGLEFSTVKNALQAEVDKLP
jgi:hypothetical protein